MDRRPSRRFSMLHAVPDYALKPSCPSPSENMVKTVRINELDDAYKTGVSAKSGKWFNHTKDLTGVIAAGQSDAAETAYNAKMTVVLSNKLRQKGLTGVTDADFQSGVKAVGASGYSTRAQAKSGKFVKKFTPFANKINETLPTLAARGTDVDANIDNRTKVLAKALHNLKLGKS